MIFDILTLFIAIFALGVSIEAHNSNKKNNEISQEPYLSAHETNDKGIKTYILQNKGNGVALIQNIEYFYGEEPTEMSLYEYLLKTYTDIPGINISTTTLGKKGIVAAGETQILGKIEYNPAHHSQMEERYNSADKKYGMRITYSSAYGKIKHWATSDKLLEM